MVEEQTPKWKRLAMTAVDAITHQAQQHQDDTNSQAKAELLKWAEKFKASIDIELPISIKGVLDAGGAVRQFNIKRGCAGRSSSFGQVRAAKTGFDEDIYLMELEGIENPDSSYRMTIIVEPVEK